MLYELISVVRPGPLKEVKDICRTAGQLVLQRGGVIRGITNWGVFHLPKPTKSVKGVGTRHNIGHYFVMRFDSNAHTQHEIRRTLGLEPRMLRFSVVKLGSTLGQIAKVEGETEEWSQWSDGRGRGAPRDLAQDFKLSSDSMNQL